MQIFHRQLGNPITTDGNNKRYESTELIISSKLNGKHVNLEVTYDNNAVASHNIAFSVIEDPVLVKYSEIYLDTNSSDDQLPLPRVIIYGNKGKGSCYMEMDTIKDDTPTLQIDKLEMNHKGLYERIKDHNWKTANRQDIQTSCNTLVEILNNSTTSTYTEENKDPVNMKAIVLADKGKNVNVKNHSTVKLLQQFGVTITEDIKKVISEPTKYFFIQETPMKTFNAGLDGKLIHMHPDMVEMLKNDINVIMKHSNGRNPRITIQPTLLTYKSTEERKSTIDKGPLDFTFTLKVIN